MKSAPHLWNAGPARQSRGVSLIEALVALAVMAIGMLGVAGMQATLRSTADLGKQRSEAVRLAQEKLEELRSFGVLVAPTGSTEHDYASIVDVAPEVVTSSNTLQSADYANTVFTRTVTVSTPAAGLPRLKTVKVKVGWWDQVGDTNVATDERTVELYSTIAQVAPVLGATLGVPANTAGPQRPGGRHVSIPRTNITPGSGDTTIFTPPGGGGVTWTFANDTGRIANVCPPVGTCVGTTSVLLSGYLRFATGAQALPAESENPTDLAISGVGVEVIQTDPQVNTIPCFTSAATPPYVAYYCVVPIVPLTAAVATFTWTGKSEVTGLPLSPTLADNTASNYKVCRYTPDPASDTPAGGNVAHPLTYASVPTSLNNQNFLVISAGNGTTPFNCPGDDGGTPLLDGDTRRHQPLT